MIRKKKRVYFWVTAIMVCFCVGILEELKAQKQDVGDYAPDRTEGEGPYERFILRGGTLIDGTGAPPIGPVDIVLIRHTDGYLKIVPRSGMTWNCICELRPTVWGM